MKIKWGLFKYSRIGAGGMIYLSSPETAAASALRGEIADSREVLLV